MREFNLILKFVKILQDTLANSAVVGYLATLIHSDNATLHE